MSVEYSIELCKTLEKEFHALGLHRPMRFRRYDEGTELILEMQGVDHPHQGKVHLNIDQFVGGGFAGQVYRVKILDVQTENGHMGILEKNKMYALKIFIPPSPFSRLFRNILYWIGFQGPFQPQVNPAAAKAGAIWQKFIRRATKIRFGDERAVNDIHAIIVDPHLGSCGELSDWVDGRTWKLEVDDHMDVLKRYIRDKSVDTNLLGSPEYRAKKQFMREFVKLLHHMGGHEFARQYEWSTGKSQPNCLKYRDTDDEPSKGVVAVDFRAGLALLPFLPMSIGDIKLILKGISRFSLVQFDRGNLKKLEQFIETNRNDFKDMLHMLEDLKKNEQIYRDSIPDITHNHVRLLFSKRLWSTILNSARTGWKVRNQIDDRAEKKLEKNKIRVLFIYILGILPLVGKFLRKILGHSGWRKHFGNMFIHLSYLRRSLRGKRIEKTISWHRSGRIDEHKAKKVAQSFWKSLVHYPLSIIPTGLHRFLTDWKYARGRLSHLIIRPFKLYFSAEMREQWLSNMVSEGQKKQMLNDEDAKAIHSHLKEPFIQKYLKSLAVHVCTLPVTQIVSVLVSWIYVRLHPEMSTPEAMAAVAAILILFQITPISPGSLVRGFYVLYLVIKEKNFKDYNIAVFLGFFKYIGYLAFPIQMTSRYPELARFMATHWATEFVHVIPVFGERGALLEHWVFRLFYNWPLTIRGRMRKIAQIRDSVKSRYWHVIAVAIGIAGILNLADFLYVYFTGIMPQFGDTWWLAIILLFFCGSIVTLGCGGASLPRRILSATVCGMISGLLYTACSILFVQVNQIPTGEIVTGCLWRIFIFTLLATIGAIFTEIRKPDPDLK